MGISKSKIEKKKLDGTNNTSPLHCLSSFSQLQNLLRILRLTVIKPADLLMNGCHSYANKQITLHGLTSTEDSFKVCVKDSSEKISQNLNCKVIRCRCSPSHKEDIYIFLNMIRGLIAVNLHPITSVMMHC